MRRHVPCPPYPAFCMILRLAFPASNCSCIREMSTANYASAYATAIAARDGQTLAALISLRSSYVNTLYASLGYHTLNTQNDLPHVSEFKRALNTVDIDGGSTAAFTLANVASKHVAVVIASCRTEMDQDGVGDIPSPRWERAHTCQLELVK